VKDGKIYEKPNDIEDQRDMMRAFSGKTNQVISWVNMCIDVKGNKKFYELEAKTDMHMIDIPEEIVQSYAIKNPGVLEASGGYRIQVEPNLVKSIDGCWNNVKGFPIEAFYNLMLEAVPENWPDLVYKKPDYSNIPNLVDHI